MLCWTSKIQGPNYHDPWLYILVISFLASLVHFVVHFYIYGLDFWQLIRGISSVPEQQEFRKFFMPSVPFLVFLYCSYDVEARLLPMNKYFEEVHPDAREMIGRMPFLDEEDVQKVIPTLNIKTRTVNTTLDAVYHEIIKKLERPREASQDETSEESTPYLLSSFWPGRILMDPKLTCEESRGFWSILMVTKATVAVILCSIFRLLCSQLAERCMDVYCGQYEGFVSVSVVLAHLACTAYAIKHMLNIGD